MGWVFAVFFLAAAFVLLLILVPIWKENASLHARVQALERQAADKAALQVERDKLAAAYSALRKRVKGIVDADEEKARVLASAKALSEQFTAQLATAKAELTARQETIRTELSVAQADFEKRKRDFTTELADLELKLQPLREEHRQLSEEASLAEMGFYKPRYGFATSQGYQKAIDDNYAQQRKMLSDKTAAAASMEWTIDGSIEKGRKQTEKYLALQVRAFNGECDAAIAKVRVTNVETMENRIRKAFASLNKLGEMQYCSISADYLDLRLKELHLEHERALKVQAEREEQRAIKEELRQQAIAEREIERAQQEAEREERQYGAALAKAREEYERASTTKQAEMQAKLDELERLVAEAQANKERAISRAQQTRSGHVYVISNLGSFGSNVYKIGMTRRLDPMDRVWELSDASVPFDFDVHAIIYTEDAPGLENELHQRFAARRVNVINHRKEFFHVTIEEIASVVRERCGDIQLTMIAEAAEYLQSEAFYRESGRPMASNRLFAYPDNRPS